MKKERVVILVVVCLILILSVSVVSASLFTDVGKWFNNIIGNNEKNNLQGGLGTSGPMGADSPGNLVPLYKLHKVNADSSWTFFYTTSSSEKDLDVSTYGYVYDGVAGYVYSTQVSGSVPLYKLHKVNANSVWTFYYTISSSEKDLDVSTYGYVYDGVAGYVLANAGNTCNPQCSGTTPKCNSNAQCVQCLVNGDCSSGQSCSNGQCIDNPGGATCTDSDDGINYYVKGQVVGPIGSGEGSKGWDYCYNVEGTGISNTGKYLLEWSCTSSNAADQTIYECPNGCTDGACINNPNDITLDSSGTSSVEMTIGGKTYIVELIGVIGASSSTAIATIAVTGPDGISETKDISVGTTKIVNGIQVYVKSASSSNTKFTAIIQVSAKPDTNTCTDSDGGINYNVKGYVLNPNDPSLAPVFDHCVDNTLFELYCNNNAVSVADGYSCPNGCSDGACINNPNVCTDTDNGANKYLKGTACYNGNCKEDNCSNQNEEDYVIEQYCSEGNYLSDKYMHCSNACNDGACIKTTPIQNDVCQNLINQVANPNDISIYGLKYTANDWDNNYRGDMQVGDQSYEYTRYSGSWNTYNSYNKEGDSYENANINMDVYVFDYKNIDLKPFVKNVLNYNICQVESYWGSNEKENIIYICNWDVLNNRQSIDSSDSKSRQVVWFKDNVLAELDINDGKSLTDAEITKLAQNKFNDFVESIKNNQAKYVGYGNFDIPYLASALLRETLKNCDSSLTKPVVDGTNETCSPSWNCKIEPIICPEYGYQTKICIDNGCNQPKREEKTYCSPGICSGCYVPRWLEDKNSLDNICIPYGTRFEQPTGNIIKKLVEYIDDEQLAERGGDDDYKLEIISENEAQLTIYGKDNNYTYTLIPGEKVEIKIPDFGTEIENYVLYTKSIVYSPEPGADNYIEITLTSSRWTQDYENMNVYCNYDGIVQKQKTVDYQGNWAKCQNNYECESNICSSGECYEVSKLIKEATGYKATFVKIFCRVANWFNIENYDQCVMDRLGLQPSSPPSSGSGGGGGSGSGSA